MSTTYNSDHLKSLVDSGALDQAKAYCEHWVKENPSFDKAWHDCGLVYAKEKEMTKALQFFERAIELNPNESIYFNNISNACVALGDLEKAKQYLNQSLRLNPNHAESYNNLGRLYYTQGLYEEAIQHLEKALRLHPNYWEAHYNLAHSFTKHNQLERAAHHYKEVLRLVPDHPNANFNLGIAYCELGQDTEAEPYLKKTLELMPDNVEAARRLGHIYLNSGNTEGAIEAFTRVVTLSPVHSEAHHNLGVLYLRNQDYQNALTHFKTAFQQDPNDETSKHMISALTGQTTDQAPRSYVVALYDQYADYFNSHLKELNYVAPSLLRNALAKCFDSAPRAGRVLDMGCGTGLCAVYFRDVALELIGVDISDKMLEKARELQAYDDLIESPIEDYLARSDLEPFDLIYSTDVLVYFGSLEAVFAGVAKHLKPKGRFAFTLEKYEKGDYFLQPNGRYAHSMEYLRRLAEKNGFIVEQEESIIPRNEVDIPVKGLLYILKKESP